MGTEELELFLFTSADLVHFKPALFVVFAAGAAPALGHGNGQVF